MDFPQFDEALDAARNLAGVVGLFKINIQLFTAAGPEGAQKIAATGREVFLDLKFHDIPNTVAGAITAAANIPGVRLLDVHTTGGAAMMRAAADALAAACNGRQRPRLLGVTVLTSLDQAALTSVGFTGSPAAAAVSLSRFAKQSGLDGVVASPHEVHAIREACGSSFLVVAPGIRPAKQGTQNANDQSRNDQTRDDQARVATPAEAIRAGADYLVVGRPIIDAPDPRAAALAITEEIGAAMRDRGRQNVA